MIDISAISGEQQTLWLSLKAEEYPIEVVSQQLHGLEYINLILSIVFKYFTSITT